MRHDSNKTRSQLGQTILVKKDKSVMKWNITCGNIWHVISWNSKINIPHVLVGCRHVLFS
jgi:hypothetical protein